MTIVVILIAVYIACVMLSRMHMQKSILRSIEILSIDLVEFEQKLPSKDDLFSLIITHYNEQKTLFIWRFRKLIRENIEAEQSERKKIMLRTMLTILENNQTVLVHVVNSTKIFLFFIPHAFLLRDMQGTLECTYHETRGESDASEDETFSLRCKVPIEAAKELSEIENAAATLLVHFYIS